MEHWKFTGDESKGKECIKRASRELGIHRDLVRLGNLSQYKTKRVFGDGLTVECQTVFSDEIIKVYYNPKGKQVTYVEELFHPTPVLDMLPTTEEDHKVVIFPACAALSYRSQYPEGNIYVPDYYEPYRLVFNNDKRITIDSLRPIHSRLDNMYRVDVEVVAIETSNPDVFYYDRHFVIESYPDEVKSLDITEILKERFMPVGAEGSFVGTYLDVLGSAVVYDAEGFDNFSSWIFVYVRAFPNNVGEVIVAMKDPVNGFRELPITGKIYYQTVFPDTGFAGVFGTAYCGIYDYYGTPYFVGSVTNIEPQSIG